MLVCNVYESFATHAGLVYDITDRLLGTKWRHSWSCFCNLEICFFNKQDVKLSKSSVYLNINSLNSILTNRACECFALIMLMHTVSLWNHVFVILRTCMKTCCCEYNCMCMIMNITVCVWLWIALNAMVHSLRIFIWHMAIKTSVDWLIDWLMLLKFGTPLKSLSVTCATWASGLTNIHHLMDSPNRFLMQLSRSKEEKKQEVLTALA